MPPQTAGIALGMGWEKLDPTPGVSRGSCAESSGIFHGISAPRAAENLWKKTFLLEKKNQQKILGFERNSWESRAGFFPLVFGDVSSQRKTWIGRCKKKIPFSFRS